MDYVDYDDLGVPADESKLNNILKYEEMNTDKKLKTLMVGTRDKTVALGEYMTQEITITNLSKATQKMQSYI